jgi:formylglycine-generating enzyme required for sulfatase activity
MHHHKNVFQRNFIFISIILLTIYSCKNKKTKVTNFKESSAIKTSKNMVWVESKTFLQGAKEEDKYAMRREMPAHEVTVDGFFMDITEVTKV